MTGTIKRAAAASVAALALTTTCIGAAHASSATQQIIQASISTTAVHPQTSTNNGVTATCSVGQLTENRFS